MRRFVIALVAAAATSAALVAQEALPGHDSNPWADQVVQLQRELAAAHADLLQRDINLSTCRATLDSVTLSDRATQLVDEFKKAFGGDWTWSKDDNRPVRINKESQR